MAEDFGKKLLAEVEEVALDEIFECLRTDDETKNDFGLPALDDLLSIGPKPDRWPAIELASIAPGGGKTPLLYHLTALATLPAKCGGKNGCVVLIDADNSFCVRRLVHQFRRLHDELAESIISETLKHVHIFQPQSLDSMVATVQSLTSYLLDSKRHHSFDRAVSFVGLDSASAFYWHDRAQSEDAALAASISTVDDSGNNTNTTRHESGYAMLTSSLKAACAALHCPALLTSWNLGPVSAISEHAGGTVRSIRPSLPAPLSHLPTLRLIAQRLPVRKFPAGISVEEALREANDRQKAVDEGRFECVVNEWNLDERTLQRMQQKGSGFNVQVEEGGLLFRTQ